MGPFVRFYPFGLDGNQPYEPPGVVLADTIKRWRQGGDDRVNRKYDSATATLLDMGVKSEDFQHPYLGPGARMQLFLNIQREGPHAFTGSGSAWVNDPEGDKLGVHLTQFLQEERRDSIRSYGFQDLIINFKRHQAANDQRQPDGTVADGFWQFDNIQYRQHDGQPGREFSRDLLGQRDTNRILNAAAGMIAEGKGLTRTQDPAERGIAMSEIRGHARRIVSTLSTHLEQAPVMGAQAAEQNAAGPTQIPVRRM
jgi:hypothetical protein